MSEVPKEVGRFCVMCATIAIASIALISLVILIWTQAL